MGVGRGPSVIMRVGTVGKKVGCVHCPPPDTLSWLLLPPAPGPQDSPQPLSRNGTETLFASVSPQEMGTGPLFPSDGQQMSQSPARLGGDRLAATNSSWQYKSCSVQNFKPSLIDVERSVGALCNYQRALMRKTGESQEAVIKFSLLVLPIG